MGRLVLLFWYCYDDHLASIFGNDSIGHVPILVWFLLIVLTAAVDLISWFGKVQGLKLYYRFRPKVKTRQQRKPAPQPVAAGGPTLVADNESDDAVEALVGLRVARPVAVRVVAQARAELGADAPVQAVTKAALRRLG